MWIQSKPGQHERATIILRHGASTSTAQAIYINGVTGIVGKPFRVVREGVSRTPDIDSIHLWLPQ